MLTLIQFLSTLSLRRATGRFGCVAVDPPYFYPRSPCGERRRFGCVAVDPPYFYPRSPCGERPVQIVVVIVYALISIHALLAESDLKVA